MSCSLRLCSPTAIPELTSPPTTDNSQKLERLERQQKDSSPGGSGGWVANARAVAAAAAAVADANRAIGAPVNEYGSASDSGGSGWRFRLAGAGDFWGAESPVQLAVLGRRRSPAGGRWVGELVSGWREGHINAVVLEQQPAEGGGPASPSWRPVGCAVWAPPRWCARLGGTKLVVEALWADGSLVRHPQHPRSLTAVRCSRVLLWEIAALSSRPHTRPRCPRSATRSRLRRRRRRRRSQRPGQPRRRCRSRRRHRRRRRRSRRRRRRSRSRPGLCCRARREVIREHCTHSASGRGGSVHRGRRERFTPLTPSRLSLHRAVYADDGAVLLPGGLPVAVPARAEASLEGGEEDGSGGGAGDAALVTSADGVLQLLQAAQAEEVRAPHQPPAPIPSAPALRAAPGRRRRRRRGGGTSWWRGSGRLAGSRPPCCSSAPPSPTAGCAAAARRRRRRLKHSPRAWRSSSPPSKEPFPVAAQGDRCMECAAAASSGATAAAGEALGVTAPQAARAALPAAPPPLTAR